MLANKGSQRFTVPSLLALGALLLAAPLSAAGPSPDAWPQFRGPHALPVSANPALPSTWSTSENVDWVVEVPGMGWSSPIVTGGKVFVTSAVSDKEMKQPSLGVDFSNDYVAELQEQGASMEEIMSKLEERDTELPSEIALTYAILCYDLDSGELLWRNDFHKGPPPVGRHRKNSYTSETPVTDGEAVYVYVAFLGLYKLDLDGKLLWTTPLEPHPVYLEFGGGASPALHGDRIFILNDNQGDSFVAAYDTGTGEHLWTTPRPGLGNPMIKSAWSTPFVWENAIRTELVTVGPGAVISYALEEGKELWRMGRMADFSIASPFAWDGLLYVASGQYDHDPKPMAAIRPGAAGDITLPEKATSSDSVVWYEPQAGGTYLPTPVIADGGLFVLADNGILAKHDPKTGERLYRSRIHRTARNFTASPWAYGGKVFAINEEGDTFVFSSGEKFELLGINSLDEFTMATPAIAGDRLLIRTQSKLYAIRGAKPDAPTTAAD